MPVLRGEQIRKSFDSAMRRQMVLDGVAITVEPGEFVAIMGASGCGKSTLLGILGCLDKADSGRYYVQDELVDWNSSRQLARLRGGTLAMVFQGFELIPHWNVADNVALALRFRPIPKDMQTEIVLTMLRKVGMVRQMHKQPFELSGGEQQRVAIARAMAGSPKVLLADEPTGNLDRAATEQIVEMFLQLHAQGTTVVMATHDDRVAERAQRVLTLTDGRFQ